MGVWKLRASWAPDEPTQERLARFAETLAVFGDPQAVIDILRTTKPAAATRVAELAPLYEQEDRDAVSF